MRGGGSRFSKPDMVIFSPSNGCNLQGSIDSWSSPMGSSPESHDAWTSVIQEGFMTGKPCSMAYCKISVSKGAKRSVS